MNKLIFILILSSLSGCAVFNESDAPIQANEFISCKEDFHPYEGITFDSSMQKFSRTTPGYNRFLRECTARNLAKRSYKSLL